LQARLVERTIAWSYRVGFRAERIFVLTTILTIGLGLTLAISRGGLGDASSSNAGLLWTLTIALVVVAAVGSAWVRARPQMVTMTGGGTATVSRLSRAPDRRATRLAVPGEALVPGLLVGGFTLFIQLFENGVLQAGLLVLAALSFAAVYWAQVHVLEIGDRYFGLAQAILTVMSHVCAFVLFATIYGLKTRSIVSASAVALVTLVLVYELLSRDVAWHRAMGLVVHARQSTVLLLSVVCGVVLGELTWGLNYWAALTTLVGGAFLLVAFYVAFGLLSHYVDHRLDRQSILEFAVVGLLATVAIFVSAFLMG
jgi:hypothetical protein